MKEYQRTTMYIQNRRDSSKFKDCNPLQLRLGLISLKPAIAYFANVLPAGIIQSFFQYKKHSQNTPYIWSIIL